MNLVPIESAYAISYHSVIVTLVLSCTVSEIWQLSCARPHPYFTLILGVFPLHQVAHAGVSKRIGLKLFRREITLEEFQPM